MVDVKNGTVLCCYGSRLCCKLPVDNNNQQPIGIKRNLYGLITDNSKTKVIIFKGSTDQAHLPQFNIVLVLTS